MAADDVALINAAREEIRAMLNRVPPGISTYGHKNSINFMAAAKEARAAADKQGSSLKTIKAKLQNLKSFYN